MAYQRATFPHLKMLDSQPSLQIEEQRGKPELLQKMILIRRFEEKAAELYGQEKIRGFLHLYNGEEAIAVGVIHQLKKSDRIISTYREHGHALAAGIDPKKIMAELYGKKNGCNNGRGGSMHLFDKTNNFFGGNAIVGGHLPIAVGMALADQRLEKDQLTCCLFGEGAVAEGIFHESLNLAGLWKVPVLFIVENNLYAMGTPIRKTLANQDFALKAKSYGINYLESDGMDLTRVIEDSKKVIDTIRTQHEPYIAVFHTYRFRAHSMFDAELYRNKLEVEEWKKKDPILLYGNNLLKEGIVSENDIRELTKQCDQIIDEAVKFAEADEWEQAEELFKHLTSKNV